MKQTLIKILSGLVMLATGVGIYFTLHSPLFLIQVVEVVDQPDSAPLDTAGILRLAAVPVGKINLFELDLDLVAQRMLSESWIRDVVIQKRFPQTLSIAVIYREPQAVVQNGDHSLSYVDTEGKIFGRVNLAHQPDLPLLTGFVGDDQFRVLDAVHLLEAWQSAPVGAIAEVSSVAWDGERGFRLLLSYTVSGRRARTMVDLGQEAEVELIQQLRRLGKVISYLGKNSIAARQIWADAGKKIVVKTAKGS